MPVHHAYTGTPIQPILESHIIKLENVTQNVREGYSESTLIAKG